MSVHYRGLRYSYDIPDPEEMDDAGVKELIEILKSSIEAGKLKDMKAALSKLKLLSILTILNTPNKLPLSQHMFMPKRQVTKNPLIVCTKRLSK